MIKKDNVKTEGLYLVIEGIYGEPMLLSRELYEKLDMESLPIEIIETDIAYKEAERVFDLLRYGDQEEELEYEEVEL